MSLIPPAPSEMASGSSSRAPQADSSSRHGGPPADAFSSPGSSAGGVRSLPSFNDLQQQASGSPRRPTRSVRRPHQPASSLVAGQDAGRPSSPGQVPPQPTWDEERAEREGASARLADGSQASGTDVFRKAQVGKAFASAATDRNAAAGRQKSTPAIDPDLEGDFGGQFEGIDDILRQIRSEYSVVMEPEFNPITLALGLLESDSSTRYNFQQLSDSLLGSLQSTVQTHSASFASSISTHNSFLGSLAQSQREVRQTKVMLVETKEALRGEKRAEINALSSRARVIKEMMDTLDTIEQLKSIPEQLETLIAEKRLLLAALVLVRSTKTISKPALREVGALSDLRGYFSTQETTLRDILLEELHNHLYLKSSYCESRWAPYATGQTKLSDPATATLASERSVSTTPSDLSRPVSTADGLADARPSNVSEKPTILARYLLDLAMRPSQDPFLDLPEDLDLTSPAFATPAHTRAGLSLASGATSMAGFAGGSSSSKAFNPEADSFVYIEHLLEALAVLGRLGWALDALAQREAVEIFGLVENVIEEVEERTADRRRQATTNLFPTSALFLPPPPSSAANGDDADEAQPTASGGKLDEDSETLRDLFWTLYSKLDAVLQGFKVTSEVASRIGSRKDFKDNSYSMLRNGAGMDATDIWRPIQTEVKGLLREYLTSSDPASFAAGNQVSSINDILRDGRSQRDRSKSLFRLANSDTKTNRRTLKRHDDELTRALQSSLPGLAGSLVDAGGERGVTVASLEDRVDGAVRSHRLLVTPEPQLVSVVFGPTLAFLTCAASVLPINLENENFGLETYVQAAYERPSIPTDRR